VSNFSVGAVDDLEKLAALLRERNAISQSITEIIGRPAQPGHIGEWIASKVFDIELEPSAVTKGIDGRFRSGELSGKSVNVKFYAKLESTLAIRSDALPDYYLVLAGPRSVVMHSRGDARPWYIDFVFLFDSIDLCRRLAQNGSAKLDEFATSIRRCYWDQAEIYPIQINPLIAISSTQRQAISLFSSCADRSDYACR
jgi:hypothetical protein